MSGADTLSRGSEAAADRRRSLPAHVLLAVIGAYRWTARLRRPSCRFHPTCSTYAAEAIGRHGALRGGALTLRRLSRCHPWNPGGVDHVPRT